MDGAPMMDLDAAAERVENALIGAIHSDVRRQDQVALAFSGGLDSTILARLLSEYMDGDVFLVVVGTGGGRDIDRARRNARFLQMPLIEVSVSEASLRADLPTIVELVGRTPVTDFVRERHGLPEGARRVNPVLVGVQCALFYAFREARPHARRVLLGQGADELFGGYRRYEQMEPEALRERMERDLRMLVDVARPIEARVAEHNAVEPRYPFLHDGVVRAAKALPTEVLVEGRRRKRVLRRVAERLGLPGDVAQVPKTAAQYGSGLAALIRRMAQKEGRPQHEWLEGFLAPVPAA